MAGSDAGGGSSALGELIEKYGDALYRDLLFFYGVDLTDTVNGYGTAPSLVLGLIRGLPDTSMCHAREAGGDWNLGWGVERHMLAQIYDALNFNTAATGQCRKKPPKFKPFPRPKKPSEKKKKKVSVLDLHRKFTNASRKGGV